MRFSTRLIAASVATALVGLFIAVVPATPARAAAGIHTMNAGVATVAEGGLAEVTISLNVAPFPGENISATVTTVDGTARSGNAVPDYTHKSQTVTFPCSGFGSCSTTQTFTVQTLGDASNEPDETIQIVLSNVQGADKGTDGTVTITDDDAGAIPTFTVIDSPVAAEGNADNNRTVQVDLNNPSDQEVTLNFATGDDTATNLASKGTPDYTANSGVLTWPAGNTDIKDITVQVKGDAIGEPNERFFVHFGGANNAALPDNRADVQLTNDDGAAPVITLAPAVPRDEGDTGSTDMTITINVAPAAPQILTVDYTTGDGSAVVEDDYEETKGTLTIAQGQSTKTVQVPIVGDQAAEPDETFTFTLTKATNATLGDPASQAYTIVNDDFGQLTTTPNAGRTADVRIFGPGGAVLGAFTSYAPPFNGGANVARGDFFLANGALGADGVDEIITGPGQNSIPRVLIFALDGTIRANFFPFDQKFPGGVSVAAGNLDGDSSNGDELIVGAGPGGGPHVKVLRVLGGANVTDLSNGGVMAYHPSFSGGVRVAAGNLSGDVRDEVVVAPGPGGGPHVQVISVNAQGQPSVVASFMAYDPSFGGGVFIAVGGGKLFTGAGAGGGPHVRLFTGDGTADGGGFYAYDPGFTGGVSVGAGNLDGDVPAEVVTGAGPGGGPHVRVFDQNGTLPFGDGFYAYEDTFHGGIKVAIGNG